MVTLTYQERFRTIKGVFDEFTNRTLFKLQSQGHFDDLLSPLEVGKESSVFIASKGEERVIVKIYYMQNTNFTKMFDYIRKDPRYAGLRRQRRQIIIAWAQREYKNLLKAKALNAKVPEVYAWRNHIIVEELIGEPALALKDAPPAFPFQFLEDLLWQMHILYQGGLIHGDLSSFNILNYEEKPVLIDFSQATVVKTPNSDELLERDAKNIAAYFSKLGVEISAERVRERVCNKWQSNI